MGYYTYFELYIIDNGSDLSDSDIYADLFNQIPDADYYLDELGETNEAGKWYSHSKDMAEFSKLHPDVLFKMSGEGEETGDIWDEYYRNGKRQLCMATLSFDPFDERKLK